MFCAAVLPLIILVITQADGHVVPVEANQSLDGSHDDVGVFSAAWWGGLWNDLWGSVQNLFSGPGVTISNEDGNTEVSAEIGGKRYNATFPQEEEISISEAIVEINGTVVEDFAITVDNETYVYETVNGSTIVMDGEGENVPDGGPFHVPSN